MRVSLVVQLTYVGQVRGQGPSGNTAIPVVNGFACVRFAVSEVNYGMGRHACVTLCIQLSWGLGVARGRIRSFVFYIYIHARACCWSASFFRSLFWRPKAA